MTILVTGGAGFIGFNLVMDLLAHDTCDVLVLDKLTYAGNPRSLARLAGERRVRFVRGDIADRELVRGLLASTRPTAVIHLAAESHVDRSIHAPAEFITTNIVGTFVLLDECRHYLATHAKPGFRFVHVSTDEVFGALGTTGVFDESTAYAPRSPYSASKASSDHLVAAYVHTYGFPAMTTNCSNNYGPYQFPEKLIPLMIENGLAGKSMPVYGRGENVRDWIHVSDHTAALRAVLASGRIGETYLIGARSERTNLQVVETVCDLLDELAPGTATHRQLVTFVADRPGHDFRYAIDPSKVERETGWTASVRFDAGIRSTIAWYIANRSWTEAIHSGAYRHEA